ncbi:MAG TPA: hypothetical protein VMV07_11345 [Streptosporangiaceae bacterium]|nr:hypothetical protein [Streptosporangiaceae bacterium]
MWTAIGTLALAIMTLAAVITSIVITVQDRRRADTALERAAHRAEAAWRKALHYECWQNIDLAKEQPPDGLWSFDTQILRDSAAHAAGFSDGVLQRIIWARTANGKLESALAQIRAGTGFPEDAATLKTVVEMRARVSGEIREIEKELRL